MSGRSPPVLLAPTSEVESILERLAVIPLEFSSERTQVFDLEIRQELERMPGTLMALSGSNECDASDVASLADQMDAYPDSTSTADLNLARDTLFNCLSDKGRDIRSHPKAPKCLGSIQYGHGFLLRRIATHSSRAKESLFDRRRISASRKHRCILPRSVALSLERRTSLFEGSAFRDDGALGLDKPHSFSAHSNRNVTSVG